MSTPPPAAAGPWLPAGCLAAAVAVAGGAFGAHVLESRLAPDRLALFDTAMRYLMYHALGLVALGAASRARAVPLAGLAGGAWLCGCAFFCGSLVALAFGAPRWLGAVAPAGGAAFIGGWAAFAAGLWREGRR